MEDSDKRVRDEVRQLDGILPSDINRRKFLAGTAASLLPGLAGCSGSDDGGSTTTAPSDGSDEMESGDGGGGETTSGSQKIIKSVIFRNAWKPGPDYSPPYVAVHEGFWEEQNIAPPNVGDGFGSGDTTRRTATDSKRTQFGNAGSGAVISALNEGLDVSIFGVHRAMPQLALIWRKDRMNSGTDLNGKTVITQGPLGEKTWPLYVDAVGADPSSVESTFAKEAVAPAQLNQGKGDALFGYFGDLTVYQSQVEAEIGITPMWRHLKVLGYPLIVNTSWLEESNNREYTKRVLQGYSHAGKWVFVNPEATVELMRTKVNPNLKTTEKSTLIEQIKAGLIAVNLTEGTKNNGFGYLDGEALTNTLSKYSQALGFSDVPGADEVGLVEMNNNADLATFTSDEWSKVREFAQPYTDILLE